MRKKDVIEHYGSETAVADALEISRRAVYAWGPVVPRTSAYELESLTKGKLKVDPKMYREQRRGGST